jgi:hypothetical protein
MPAAIYPTDRSVFKGLNEFYKVEFKLTAKLS